MPLDLHDSLPLWERKLAHPLHQPELNSAAGRNVDLAETARREHVVRDGRILTQDIVRTIIIRQRRIQR